MLSTSKAQQYSNHYTLITSGNCKDLNSGETISDINECEHASVTLKALPNNPYNIIDEDAYSSNTHTKPPGCTPYRSTSGSTHYLYFYVSGNVAYTCGPTYRCICIYDPMCLINQKVVNYECVNCPAGKTNAAGDNSASGSDTYCDNVICGSNQHVSNHVCTTCPTGKVRIAGDDASSGDTECEFPCEDTAGWDDLYSYTCPEYRNNGWCSGNQVVSFSISSSFFSFSSVSSFLK